MTTILLVLAVVVAAACPLHMLWRMRRGHGDLGGACCGGRHEPSVDEVRDRRRAVAAELQRREAPEPDEILT